MLPATAILIGASVSTAGALYGGAQAASAAKKQAQSQNEATQRQFSYDNERWHYDKQRIIANRDQAIEEIKIAAANEGKEIDWREAANLQRYNYDLLINQREQESLDEQFVKSEQVFHGQTELNNLEALTAAESEQRQLNEIRAEAAFTTQEAYLEQLQAEGRLRARLGSGRSADKATQVKYANYGYQLSMINESIASAGRNARVAIENIDRDRLSANLAAQAARMLDPGVLPDPIQPLELPRRDYILPRALQEYDFGPQPVLGAMASPSAAANQVWGSTIANVAGTIGSAFASSAAYMGGGSQQMNKH